MLFFANNIYWVAISVALLASSVDYIFRKRNNVKTRVMNHIWMGGGGATHVVVMIIFGSCLLLGSQAPIDVLMAGHNKNLLAVAAIFGAASLTIAYFSLSDPYGPPVETVGQKVLQTFGHYKGNVDGHSGKKTRQANRLFLLEAMQGKHGEKAKERADDHKWAKGMKENGPKICNSSLLVMAEAIENKFETAKR